MIVDDGVWAYRTNRNHFGWGMPVARVVRVGVETEALTPVAALPQLGLAEQFAQVVVLHSAEVPEQPADRVATTGRLGGERSFVEAVAGGYDQRGDSLVQLDEQSVCVHDLVPSVRSTSVRQGLYPVRHPPNPGGCQRAGP